MGNNALRIRPGRAVLAGAVLAALPMASFAFVSVGVSITVEPPALPVYVQPACPGVGYIWTPGYWAWGDGDYYWVPGTWVLAPSPGLLWTPGYWGWGGGLYVWHPGYWGPHVGFYGGINYGFGYTGVGFSGGYWRGHDFYYNRAYSNLGGLHVTNVYNRTVVNNVTINRVSFNGGEHGIHAQPNSEQLAAEHEHHVDFTPVQREHEHMAFGNHDLRASVNGGKPRIAATARPTSFTGQGVIGARSAGAPYHAPEHAGGEHGASAHGAELHAGDRGPAGSGHFGDMRSDRPAGATGGAGRGPEMHAGGPTHNVEARGGVPRGAEMRTDRPPGAAGSGSAGIHGAMGGGAGGPGHGPEMHGGGLSHDSPHMAVAHNDRPPSAGGGGFGSPHVNQMRTEHNAPPEGHSGGNSSMPHQFNSGGGQAGPRPQAHMEEPRQQPRMEAGPHMQSPPHMEAQRPQAAPRMESAPRQEMHRGGGEPPHGQGGGSPRAQSHGQEHGRR